MLNDTLIQNGTSSLTNSSINLTVNVIAENLISRLVMDFSAYLPFISLLIAVYSIYLSQLQGAKIKLVEKPNIELIELQEQDFNGYVPSFLPIKKLDLFFINSGNRAGILKDVHASILLEENAKSYLKGSDSIKVKYGNNSENNDFLIILDRSVGHVFIDKLDLQAIDIKKGATFTKFDSIRENTGLIEIINTIFHLQMASLKYFIEFIDKNSTFGKLKVSYKCTGRKYLLREEIKNEKFNLKIEKNFIKTIERYKQLLHDWDHLAPTNEKVISNLISFLETRCKPMIEKNESNLMLQAGYNPLADDTYNNLIEFNLFEYNLLRKWGTSRIYSEKLYDLMEKMKDYTKIYNKVIINPTLHDEWNRCRMDLITQCVNVLNQTDVIIVSLKNILVEQNDSRGHEWIFRWS